MTSSVCSSKMHRSKAIEASEAIILLRKKIRCGEMSALHSARSIWVSRYAFSHYKHKLETFRTRFNCSNVVEDIVFGIPPSQFVPFLKFIPYLFAAGFGTLDKVIDLNCTVQSNAQKNMRKVAVCSKEIPNAVFEDKSTRGSSSSPLQLINLVNVRAWPGATTRRFTIAYFCHQGMQWNDWSASQMMHLPFNFR